MLNPTKTDIVIGDALAHLRTMAPRTVDSIVTDPPYGIATDGSMLGQVSANYHRTATHSRGYADNDPRRYQDWCTEWMSACLAILKPGGHLVSFGGPPTIHRLITAAEDTGFEVRTMLVWVHRPGAARGAFLTDQTGQRTGLASTLNPGFEPLVLLRKPIETKTLHENVALHGTGALRAGDCAIPRLEDGDRLRHPSTVAVAEEWDLTAWGSPFFTPKPTKDERRVGKNVAHPTVKPLDLMRYLVRLATPQGGYVLDPFAGSGTTLEAATLEGLHCTVIEQDATYRPTIEARLARARGVSGGTETGRIEAPARRPSGAVSAVTSAVELAAAQPSA